MTGWSQRKTLISLRHSGVVNNVAPLPDVPLLSLRKVVKRFGGTIALNEVDIDIFPGEVHALIGENGAGKSTLGKLLYGALQPDAGVIRLNGQPVQFSQPADGLQHGLIGIAQELSLMATRSVLDNIVLAQEQTWGPFINDGANLDYAQNTMERFDLYVDPRALVSDLTIADQQKVEILRALSRKAKLIVFDEPTARLSEQEAKTICKIIRVLADTGCAVIYVSHFLDEVLSLANRISVLRNGHLVQSSPAKDENRDNLIEAMTGTSLNEQFPQLQPLIDSENHVLEVKALRIGTAQGTIDFTICSGEILGLSGLVGAGRSEIGQAIMGALASSGTIKLNGTDISGMSIADRIETGIAYIPESRRDQGLMMTRPIQENIGLPYLKRISSFFGLSQVHDRKNAQHHSEITGIKYGHLLDEVSTLSGGNQQKVLFARASLGAPKLLIIDEPTRGVDVKAKRQIYDLVVQMAQQGAAILLISSEIEEIMGLCHRVEVIAQGAQVASLPRSEFSEARLMQAAFSGV